jgi:hypothetical protein
MASSIEIDTPVTFNGVSYTFGPGALAALLTTMGLGSATGSFGPAGAGHHGGLVPDPGSTTHTPPWLLGDDDQFHIQFGQLLSIGFFSSSQTITIPASATKALVWEWGGTGGSGGVDIFGQSTGGTGAAANLIKLLSGLTPGNTLIFTAGAAGGGGANNGGNPGLPGGNGTASVLASGTQTISTLTAGGSNGSGGAGDPGIGATVSGGTPGGTATGGDINISGVSGSTAGVPGVMLFSAGASGVSGVSVNGLPGTPGGMFILWFS